MAEHERPDEPDEAFWRDYLTRGQSLERRMRGVFRRIPSEPRCRLCAAPFGGPGAPLMRALGKRRASQNPNMCHTCFAFIADHHGGAEIEITMLFADIRGSTTIAEGMSSGAFRALLDRFYTVASTIVFDHDGTVDKFVGDELVAMFFPLLSGNDHPRQGIDAALALLRATGHDGPDGPFVPIGAGVHTAWTWFGAVGQGARTELDRRRRRREHDRPTRLGRGGRRGPRHGPGRDGGRPARAGPRAPQPGAEGQDRPDGGGCAAGR